MLLQDDMGVFFLQGLIKAFANRIRRGSRIDKMLRTFRDRGARDIKS